MSSAVAGVAVRFGVEAKDGLSTAGVAALDGVKDGVEPPGELIRGECGSEEKAIKSSCATMELRGVSSSVRGGVEA